MQAAHTPVEVLQMGALLGHSVSLAQPVVQAPLA